MAALFAFEEQFRDAEPPEYGSVVYWEGWFKRQQEARDFEAEAHPSGMDAFRDRVQELHDKQEQWRDYAQGLVEEPPGGSGEARKELEDKIRHDLEDRLKEWGVEAPPWGVDAYVGKVVDDLGKTVPALAGTPVPAAANPEGRVTARGGFDIDPRTGYSPESAIANPPDPADYFTVTENTMTLTFNTGGGAVTGDSRLHYEQQRGPTSLGCGMDSYDESIDYEGANVLEDPRVFRGTGTLTYEYVIWYVEDQGEGTTCVEKRTGGTGVTLSWDALWEHGVVTGHGLQDFRLTLAGQ